MRIIPVIDVLGGNAVHGVGGKRAQYKPVKSVLVNSSEPLEIARAFKRMGLLEVYIADLDAIEGTGDNFEHVRKIKKVLGMHIMLDPGVRVVEDLAHVLGMADEIILATETLSSHRVLEEAGKLVNNIIVSIDMKKGIMLSDVFKTPEEAVSTFERAGIRKFILLDLQNVGSMRGAHTEMDALLKGLSQKGLHIITGGGIKTIKDVISLERKGVSGALIATALHNGTITREDIQHYRSITS